jgi:trimethylamine-N-oxide reductase (cytochrome c)
MTLENDCLFADIVLPINTKVEENDIVANSLPDVQMRGIWLERQAIGSIGESMSDYEAVCEVAKKLGKYEEFTVGRTIDECIEYGWEMSGVADLVSWEDLNEKQFYAPPVADGWQDAPAGLINFYQNPEDNPLATPTGFIEIESTALLEHFPDDNERPPYPQYVIGGPASEGWTYDETIDIEGGAEKCRTYSLLLISNHPRWRHHVQLDDVSWLREIPTCKVRGYDGYMYEPVWIHPTDAEARGIKHGDIVKVYNDRGIELGGAYVTERIIPGAVYMDHGARVDMVVCDPSIPKSQWVDRGGAVNNISLEKGVSKNCWGMATSGYLVEAEKLNPAEMEEWKSKYPEAFARDYDPASGLMFNGWVEGGM